MAKRKDSETPVADIAAVAKDATPAEPPKIEAEKPAEPEIAAEPRRWRLPALPAYAPLAAGIALAVVVGALAGAAATSALVGEPSAHSSQASAEATRALQNSVARLGSELATLKAGIATSQRTASTQFGKLSERLERTEKAQAEPAARLAKLQESIDKLDHRQVAAASSSDITGSVTPKDAAKPQIAEGWRLHDFYAGRAVVESRNGMMFEVGPGANLPGLGKVEGIKRENGRIVVVTQKGIIAAALPARRPSYAMPYRY